MATELVGAADYVVFQRYSAIADAGWVRVGVVFRGVSMVVPLVAVAVLLAASTIRLRLPRWHDRNSRPFTVALAALAGAALLDGFDEIAQTGPITSACIAAPDHVLDSILTVGGACMFAISVAAAWELRTLRTFRLGAVALVGLVPFGYVCDMFTPCDWPHLYLVPMPVVGAIACSAVLVTTLTVYRHVPESERVPLWPLAGGALFGLAASAASAWGLICCIEHHRASTVLGCMSVILYAASGLVAARQRLLKERAANTA